MTYLSQFPHFLFADKTRILKQVTSSVDAGDLTAGARLTKWLELTVEAGFQHFEVLCVTILLRNQEAPL